MSAPEKLSPPVVSKVTHYNIELHWDQERIGNDDDDHDAEAGRRRYCVQEEHGMHKGFGNVYNGYAMSNLFKGLDPGSTYKYRVRAINDHGNGPWSSAITVTTTRVPLSGADIHKAILNWEVERVEKILKESEGSLVNVPDIFGMSPLMIASQKGYSSIVEVLVDNGAVVNHTNSSGKTSVMLACFGGHLGIVTFLKDHEANLTLTDNGGSSALHWSVDGDKIDCVKWLLENGVDVDAEDNSGWSPLLRLANMGGNVEVAKVLIENGAKVNKFDKTCTTSLMAAALSGYKELCELLVDNGADVAMTNENGSTALEFAESFERKDVIGYLTKVTEEKG